MASEIAARVPEEQQALEQKISDLHIDENGKKVAESAKDDVDGEKETPADSAAEEQGDLQEYKDKVSDVGSEKPADEASEQEKLEVDTRDLKEDVPSREVEIARSEAAKSSEAAYVVPATDHQSRVQGDFEKKEDVPTGIVHENADSKGMGEQQQSKGILQSVTGRLSQTVKSVFGGRSGSKSSKDLEVKKTGYEEQT